MGSIYKITNTVNGKAYIGQTRHDAEKTRIRDHFAGNGSQLVKQAIEKYGKDAFTFEILHDGIIPEFLDDLEREYIEKYNTIVPHGYNLRTGGRGGACSEETQRKISEANKGNIPWNKGKKGLQTAWNKGKKGLQTAWNKGKKGSTPNWLGRKHTDETLLKISESKKGNIPWNKGKKGLQTSPNKGKKGVFTDETLRKMSNPDYIDARDFFFSLPPNMNLKEKRKILYNKFPNTNKITMRHRIYRWQSELEQKT